MTVVADEKEGSPSEVPTDPVRQIILREAAAHRKSLSWLSEQLGRNKSYMHQFLYRGSPQKLSEDVRLRLAELLDLDPAQLKAPSDLPPPTAASRPSRGPEVRVALGRTVQDEGPTSSPPDVPVFSDTWEVVLPERGPITSASVSAPSIALALMISLPRGRLQAGDLAYVSMSQPIREGDIAVVLQGRTIRAIGDVVRRTGQSTSLRITCNPGEQGTTEEFPHGDDFRFLKVVSARYA